MTAKKHKNKKTAKKASKPKQKIGKKRRKTVKKVKVKFSSLRFVSKWLLISMIWSSIALFCVLVYFAYDLPKTDNIIDIPHKTGITILAYNNSVIGRYGSINGDNIYIKDLPAHMINALLAIEDRRFYKHFGLDPKGILRAMWQNLNAGHFVQGGSTITQQLAKNMFLTADKTLRRKVQEALLSLWLEQKLSKDDILSAYLNRVYFGAGAYGIDAASRTYFNKPAHEITITEAALLAGLLKAPSRYSPFSNPDLTIKRTKTVLHAMNDAGYLSSKEIINLSSNTVPIHVTNSYAATTDRYFIDWVINNIGGFVSGAGHDLIVKTTFDPAIQQAATRHLHSLLDKQNIEPKPQAAFIAMTPDGAIRAMIGGKNYQNSRFNRATQALRQPGSAFKPFVYLTALTHGWKPSQTILDAPITTGTYHPKNFANKYYGSVTLQTALAKSLNTATVRLTQNIGIGNVIKTAKKAGIHHKLRRDMSLALGSSEVSLLELSSAYAVFANDGYAVYPFAITEIKETNGTVIYSRDLPSIERIFKAKDIRNLNRMLSHVITDGTGKRAHINNTKVHGKTGTSQNSRDAWFIGYTDSIIGGVWFGYDNNAPMPGITGGNLPTQLWHDVMKEIQPTLKTVYQHDPILQYHNKKTASGLTGVLQRLFPGNSKTRNIEYDNAPRYNN